MSLNVLKRLEIYTHTDSRSDDNERRDTYVAVARCAVEKFSKILIGEAKVEASIGREVNDYRIEP